MSAGGAIGDLAIGDIEAEVAAAVAACVPGERARFIRRRIAAMFVRRGAENARLKRVEGGATLNVLSVWTMTRAEELVGEVKQSDQTVLIEPTAFDGAGWPLPIRRGDRIVRWPGEAREAVHTVIETPGVFASGSYDLLYRLIVRG
ncbi:MAG: hypothetical protein K2Q06_06115 [Parvularculaceae bacterium]|nr:hypothetical protein [Parvularculaceae bacterium]